MQCRDKIRTMMHTEATVFPAQLLNPVSASMQI